MLEDSDYLWYLKPYILMHELNRSFFGIVEESNSSDI